MPTEERTLGELHAAIAALDPGARLRDLTSQLVTLNDRLHHLETDYSVETNPDRVTLHVAELETLRANQHDVRTLIATERQTINRRTFTPTDHDTLRAAITHRTATIYQQTISNRPEWLIEVLTELDDRGTLGQLRAGQVRQLVLDRATTEELSLGGHAPDPGQRVERLLARIV